MANQIIIDIGAVANDGTGDPLRTAFGYVNDNFSNIWSTGVANSNVAFSGNKIITVNTNGNLVLAPNGTGKVVANVDIVPNTANTRNLGALTNRWSTVYSQYLNVSNDFDLTGDLTIGGNLTVEGDIIEMGNIVTDSKTIQLANTAANATSANGSGITVGASDNIATMLYNSGSNSWVLNIGLDTPNIVVNSITSDDSTFVTVEDGLNVVGEVTASGNITAPYFIGNGSQLTGITSYANANVVAYANAGWAGNIIPATSNVYSLGNATNQWNDLYISNATIYMNNVPIGLTAANVLTVNGANVVTATAGGNIDVNNIVSNSNIAIDTSAERVTVSVGSSDWVFDETGVLTAPGEVETVGNISAGYFLGNGSQLTGLPEQYGNANVAAFLAAFGSNTVSTTGNITAGNVGITGNLAVGTGGNTNVLTVKTEGGVISIGNQNDGTFVITDPNFDPSIQVAGQQFYITTNDNSYQFTFGVNGSANVAFPGNLDLGDGIDSKIFNAGNNISITANTASWMFGTDGVLTAPGNVSAGNIVVSSGLSTLVLGKATATGSPGLSSTSSLTFTANRAGTTKELSFNTSGDLSAPGNVSGGNLVTPGTANVGTISMTWLDIGNVGNIASLEANVKLQIVADAGNTAPYWTFNNDGNLFVPGSINGDNGAPLLLDGAASGEGYVSLPNASFGGEQIAIVNKFSLGNGIRLETNGGNLFFDNDGVLTAPGNITTTGNIAAGNITTTGNIATGNLNATTGIANVANLYMGNGYVNTSASAALNLVPGGAGGTRVWSKLVPNANVAFSLGSSTEYWANGYIGNVIATTGNFTGNVTAANFSGNISITGNVTGTSANVTLVAGAYSAVFDNTGVATFPGDLKGDILVSTNSSGSEGGEIQLSLPTAGNTTLSGTNIIIDSYSDRIRFFEGGGNARGMYIDLANSPDGQVNAAIGYRDVPQIALGANVTANLTNAGKHFYSTTAGNLQVTIPDNANVAFPTGATITVVVNAAGNVIVAQGTGVSLYMAGSSTTGNRTVGAYGLASVMKVATDTWVISGTGVY